MSKRSGFTLIELIVVLAIIGLLAGMLLTALSSARTSAKKARARADTKQIELAWKMYMQEYHRFPEEVTVTEMGPEAVSILRGDDSADAMKDNPKRIVFLDFQRGKSGVSFKDPWGAVYRVKLATKEEVDHVTVYGQNVPRAAAVWSAGPDGALGTADDLKSWE